MEISLGALKDRLVLRSHCQKLSDIEMRIVSETEGKEEQTRVMKCIIYTVYLVFNKKFYLSLFSRTIHIFLWDKGTVFGTSDNFK